MLLRSSNLSACWNFLLTFGMHFYHTNEVELAVQVLVIIISEKLNVISRLDTVM